MAKIRTGIRMMIHGGPVSKGALSHGSKEFANIPPVIVWVKHFKGDLYKQEGQLSLVASRGVNDLHKIGP